MGRVSQVPAMRWIALSLMVGACNIAFAQATSWKIVVDAADGWGQSFSLEVVASGLLVISNRRSTETPRCMTVSADDIAYMTQRIARLQEYVDNEDRSPPLVRAWSARIDDGLEARMDVYLAPRSHVLSASASLGSLSLYESDRWRRFESGEWLQERPPQFLAEILAKVWEWQRAEVAACVPVPGAQ